MGARLDASFCTVIADMRKCALRGDVDLTVVVPTYQEVDNVRPLVSRIFEATERAACSAEVLIVDDDSRDGTDEEVRTLAQDYNVRMITRRDERGLATAALLGLREAKGSMLLVMDADLSHPPELIPDFVRALRTGAEFVMGSRFSQKQRSRRAGVLSGGLTPPWRRFRTPAHGRIRPALRLFRGSPPLVSAQPAIIASGLQDLPRIARQERRKDDRRDPYLFQRSGGRAQQALTARPTAVSQTSSSALRVPVSIRHGNGAVPGRRDSRPGL